MPQATITAKIHEAFNIHGHLAPEVTLHFAVPVHGLTNFDNFSLSEIVSPGIKIYAGLGQDLLGGRAADAVDISESHLDPFISW
jgi:hypothetical protein